MDASFDEKSLLCKEHSHPSTMILLKNDISFMDSLLCQECLNNITISTKLISTTQAKQIILNKHQSWELKEAEVKGQNVKLLKEFKSQVSLLNQQLVWKFEKLIKITDEWIDNYIKLEPQTIELNILREMEILQKNNFIIDWRFEHLEKLDIRYLKRIDPIFGELLIMNDYLGCYETLTNIGPKDYEYLKIADCNCIKHAYQNGHGYVKHSIIDRVKQMEWAQSLAFNNIGNIMVAGCDQDIKVWQFEDGKMIEIDRLYGHNEGVSCLVFSKKQNWFISGSWDYSLISWYQTTKKNILKKSIPVWGQEGPYKQHTNYVMCILLNENEDELITSGWDHTYVWQIEGYKLNYDYTLDSSNVQSMSLNEKMLVTCNQEQIILWLKVEGKWKNRSHIITESYGYRISFINDYQIVWASQSSIHLEIFDIVNEEIHKKDQIQLNEECIGDSVFFPAILNKERGILIWKHSKFVYIIRQQICGKLKIVSQPIDCEIDDNFGTLTNNGNYLVIWNYKTTEFRVYKLNYQ